MPILKLSILIFAPFLFAGAATETPMPWDDNGPIVDVQRVLYQEHPAKGVGAWVSVRYVGPGVLREKIHTHMATSDTPRKPLRRRSKDNGRSWSSFEPVPEIVRQVQGQRVYWGSGSEFYDAEH